VVFEPELLASLYGAQQEEREIVPLARVPKPLQDAVLAAEGRAASTTTGGSTPWPCCAPPSPT
jgi:hypothetical protein